MNEVDRDIGKELGIENRDLREGEKVPVAAEDFVGTVAREDLEDGVDVDDREIGLERVGYDERRRSRRVEEDARFQRQLALLLFSLRAL